jgi:hypothetical protein
MIQQSQTWHTLASAASYRPDRLQIFSFVDLAFPSIKEHLHSFLDSLADSFGHLSPQTFDGH